MSLDVTEQFAQALNETMDVREMAEQLGVTQHAAGALVRRGVVPAIRVGQAIRVPRDAVKAELDRRQKLGVGNRRFNPLPGSPPGSGRRGKTTPKSTGGSFAPHVGGEQEGSLSEE